MTTKQQPEEWDSVFLWPSFSFLGKKRLVSSEILKLTYRVASRFRYAKEERPSLHWFPSWARYF